MKMEVIYDHYKVLGLPSGKEGTKLNQKEIRKAYRAKALQLHPDKRPNDPNANEMFQMLNSSYAILSDPKLRKSFDSVLMSLDNKPPSFSSSKAKRPNCHFTDYDIRINTIATRVTIIYMFVGGIIMCAIFAVPAGAVQLQWSLVLGSFSVCCAADTMSDIQKLNSWLMIVRAWNYLKGNLISQAAANRESQRDEVDHEDIEDWVIV